MTGRNFAGESHFQHVARLPWLPTQPTGTRKIDDTNFYKKLIDGQSTDGIYKHKLFRLLNSVNPFYLPLRYRVLLFLLSILLSSSDLQD